MRTCINEIFIEILKMKQKNITRWRSLYFCMTLSFVNSIEFFLNISYFTNKQASESQLQF